MIIIFGRRDMLSCMPEFGEQSFEVKSRACGSYTWRRDNIVGYVNGFLVSAWHISKTFLFSRKEVQFFLRAATYPMPLCLTLNINMIPIQVEMT
jgi:hypothetical protein